VLFYVFLCCSIYCLFCVVLCIVCVYMCTEILPPGGYPIAVKYIISYNFSKYFPLFLVNQLSFCGRSFSVTGTLGGGPITGTVSFGLIRI